MNLLAQYTELLKEMQEIIKDLERGNKHMQEQFKDLERGDKQIQEEFNICVENT